MNLRELQRPLKERYREDPEASRITLTARGSVTDQAVTCSVDIGRMVYEAQAHPGVGGPGTGACSGDLLLGALAACAQVTTQMVATSMGIPFERIQVGVAPAGRTDGDIARQILLRSGVGAERIDERAAAVEEACCREFGMRCPPDLRDRVAPGMTELLDDLATRDGVRLALLTGNFEPVARLK